MKAPKHIFKYVMSETQSCRCFIKWERVIVVVYIVIHYHYCLVGGMSARYKTSRYKVELLEDQVLAFKHYRFV